MATANIRDSVVAEPTYITPIDCLHCGEPAHLANRVPAITGDGVGEIRTFECSQCHASVEMFIRNDL